MKKFIAIRIAASMVTIGIILMVVAIQRNHTRQTSPSPSAPPSVDHPIPPVVEELMPPPPVVEEAPVENVSAVPPAVGTLPTLDELERQVGELERRFKTTTSDLKVKQSALDALGDE